jgi:predicted metal-binding protein
MKKVIVVGCGAYMANGYGCPGEWRCLKAAALGEGGFSEPHQVVGFVRCECPGRTIASNTAMAIKLSEIKPDAIYFSSCLVKPKPGCPYGTPEEFAQIVKGKTGIEVTLGTHQYPE